MKVYDFRKYRTPDCIITAIVDHLEHEAPRKGRLRAECPRKECNSKGKHLLSWHSGWPIAYCHGCNRSLDALELIVRSTGKDYFYACDYLEMTCFGG